MEKTIKKVTCLVCNWQSEEESGIENANWHGECLNCPERLLRWDYADGSIAITNSDALELAMQDGFFQSNDEAIAVWCRLCRLLPQKVGA